MMKIDNKKHGFTLIEILIAISLASAVMGMVIFMVISSLELRKKSINLNKAIFLAENTMNTIKNKKDLPDDSGEFPDYPEFSFSYSMKEIDYDPLSGLTGATNTEADEVLQQYREGQSTELSTGLTFRMRQYNVNIFYKEKLLYELESLRGLQIEQTSK